MRLSTTAVLACAAITLAGCSGDNAPASPPTPSEPLTTSSPTTVDTDVETVTATTQPPADPVETTATADGPPEMPDEAREDSEAGAEAFALHYIDLINYTGMYPQVGLLEPLAAGSCGACDNYADNVTVLADERLHNSGPAVEVNDARAADLGDSTRVDVEIRQLPIDVVDSSGTVVDSYEQASATMVFDLTYQDSSWRLHTIRIAD